MGKRWALFRAPWRIAFARRPPSGCDPKVRAADAACVTGVAPAAPTRLSDHAQLPRLTDIYPNSCRSNHSGERVVVYEQYEDPGAVSTLADRRRDQPRRGG